MAEIIKTTALKKIYYSGNLEVRALNGVDLSISEGEFIAIVGSSGSGKTTLLNMIGGLDNPTNGVVTIRGVMLSNLDEEELTVFRRKNIGFIFQNYNLVPVLSVYENIALPSKLDGAEIDEDFLLELVHSLEIEDKLYQMPSNLSGGQQQRVAIARALITRPAIVLADEPTGNLDSKTSNTVISILKDMASQFHQTMAVVTHNEAIASKADRTIRIEDGVVIDEEGSYE